MKKLIKTLAVIAATATLAFGFASCSSSGSDDTPTVVPGTGTGTGTTTTPTNTTPTNTTPTNTTPTNTTPTNTTPTNTTPTTTTDTTQTTPTTTPAAEKSADFSGSMSGVPCGIHFKDDGSYVIEINMGGTASPWFRGTYTIASGDFTNGTIKLQQKEKNRNGSWIPDVGNEETYTITNGTATVMGEIFTKTSSTTTTPTTTTTTTDTTPTTTPTTTGTATDSAIFKGTVMGTEAVMTLHANKTYILQLGGQNYEKGTYILEGTFDNGKVTITQTHAWKHGEWKEEAGAAQGQDIKDGKVTVSVMGTPMGTLTKTSSTTTTPTTTTTTTDTTPTTTTNGQWKMVYNGNTLMTGTDSDITMLKSAFKEGEDYTINESTKTVTLTNAGYTQYTQLKAMGYLK